MRPVHFLIFAVIGVISLTPIAFLVFGSLWSGSLGMPGHLTLQNFIGVAESHDFLVSTADTVVFAVGSGLVATFLGTLLALAVSRTDAYFRRTIGYALVVLLALPWFVEDIGWTYLANPSNGLLNLAVRGVTGGNASPFDVYSLGGMILAMGLNLSSLAYLVVYSSLSNMDGALEEMARISGSGVLSTLRRVHLALSRPAVLATFFLSLVVAAESFDIAAIIGAPAGIPLLAYSIYRYTYVTPPDYGSASAASFVLVALTSVAFYLYLRAVKVSDRYATVTGRKFRASVVSLGRWRIPVSLGLVAYFVAYPALILGTLFFASLHYFWNPNTLGSLTLSNYVSLVDYPSLGAGIENSLVVSAASAAFSVGLAFYLAYASSRFGGRATAGAQFVSNLPLAIPSIVIGLGLLWTIFYVPLGIYGTIWGLVIAYVVRYTPIAARFLGGPTAQIDRELEDASRVCGANSLQTVRNITVPLLKSALTVSLIYVFVVTIKDLGAAVMLVTGQNLVVSYSIYTIWLTGHYLVAAASGSLLVIFVALGVLALAVLLKVSPLSIVQPGRRGG